MGKGVGCWRGRPRSTQNRNHAKRHLLIQIATVRDGPFQPIRNNTRMIAQLITFLFIAYCSFVSGIVIRNRAKWSYSFMIDFLLGFAFCNAVFTLISIFSPVTEQVAYAFLTVIVGINIAHRAEIKAYFVAAYARVKQLVISHPVYAGIASVFILIMFSRSLYNPEWHYDAGLYHIQSIKWISEYPTVPGLANIDYTYGYNFNIFTWFAATSFQGVYGQPIYAINFTLLFFFTGWLSIRLIRVVEIKRYLPAIGYLMVFFCLVTDSLPHISTTTNNISIFILVSVLLISLTDSAAEKGLLFPLTVLSIYAVTSKLSAIPLLIIPLYAIIRGDFFTSKKDFSRTCSLSSAILLPWLAKNVLLTGWLLFPFPYLNLFSFGWAVPKEDVMKTTEIIKSYLQNSVNTTQNDWIRSWVFRQTIGDLFTVGLAFVLLSTVLLAAVRKKVFIPGNYIIGVLIALLGFMFTMYNAPSLAYCIGYFSGMSVLLTRLLYKKVKINPYLFRALGIVLIVLFLKDNWFHPWHFIKNSSSRLVTPYPVDPVEKRMFGYFMIDNKERCYYPINSDQCFDHTLPCIPKRIVGLHLRNKALGQGFFVDNKPVK